MTAVESNEVPTDSAKGTLDIEVSRVVPLPVDKVWQVLTTPAGAEALLGAGAQLGTKGEPWRSVDGSHGVVRSYHPLQQVRLTWHANDKAPATLVDLQLTAEGDGTRMGLRQEHIHDVALSQSLQQRWEDALGRIGDATT